MKDDGSTRLLVVAINYAPELTGIGKYVGEMTQWLATRNIDIRVVTAPPYYPAWAVSGDYRATRYKKEIHEGVTVYRCPLWVPRRPRGATRILHLLSFALSSLPVILWQALFWRPHVVFVVEPPICAAPAAWIAARIAGARAWLHVQDLEIDAAFELGLLRRGFMRRAVLAAERWLMRRFDQVSNISEGMRLKLRAKGVKDAQALCFPNWVDMELIRPMARNNALRTELGIDDNTRVLLYSGNMGEKQGLEVILDVARQFLEDEDKDILFLLCGDGVVRERIACSAAKLPNVRLMPLQPIERLNELLNLADVHLLPQRAAAEDLTLPSKLGAILASGRPVVATARHGSDVARFAETGGLVVAPADTVAFENAIRQLLDDAALSRRLGVAGRAYAYLNWERENVMRRTFAHMPAFGRFAPQTESWQTEEPSSALLHADDQAVAP
jgi:colanic acid biosynthesis glycosyl transferase WcaI